MLSTTRITGSLPDPSSEVLNWLPVELAAKVILELSRSLVDFTTGVEIPV
jgi:hypothetical protein